MSPPSLAVEDKANTTRPPPAHPALSLPSPATTAGETRTPAQRQPRPLQHTGGGGGGGGGDDKPPPGGGSRDPCWRCCPSRCCKASAAGGVPYAPQHLAGRGHEPGLLRERAMQKHGHGWALKQRAAVHSCRVGRCLHLCRFEVRFCKAGCSRLRGLHTYSVEVQGSEATGTEPSESQTMANLCVCQSNLRRQPSRLQRRATDSLRRRSSTAGPLGAPPKIIKISTFHPYRVQGERSVSQLYPEVPPCVVASCVTHGGLL